VFLIQSGNNETKQAAQLSQRNRATLSTLRVIEYFAKSLKSFETTLLSRDVSKSLLGY